MQKKNKENMQNENNVNRRRKQMTYKKNVQTTLNIAATYSFIYLLYYSKDSTF